MNYLISIIVPVYNVELYLEKCLDSLINQTYKNVEIILVNDGSKDSSGSICDRYKQKDSRIKVFHQDNNGQSSARNKGLKNCNGDYIAFVDSDDWIELDMCNIIIQLLVKNQLDVVEFEINDRNFIKHPETKFIVQDTIPAAYRILEKQHFSVCRRIYHKALIEGMAFNEDYIYEDMLFTSELLCKITKMGYYNEPLYNYYIDNTSSTMHGSFNAKRIKAIDTIFIFKKNIEKCFTDAKIIAASKKYILSFAVQHYLQLFQHDKIDAGFVNRKRLKTLINTNYDSQDKNDNYTKTARYCPMLLFGFFSRLIQIRKHV